MFNEFISFGGVFAPLCSNDDSIEKFINIDIYFNFVFLFILESPNTGGPHGVANKFSAGHL